MAISIRDFRDADLEPLIELLVEAFEHDPSFARWFDISILDDHRETLERLFRTQITADYLTAGTIDLAVDDDNLVGAALWRRPGESTNIVEQIKTVPEYARIFGHHAPTALYREKVYADHHPKYPHWYLWVIGVSPKAQGQGVGSTLLDHGIERGGDDALYLEASTARSAKLYHSKGFEPMGPIELVEGTTPEFGMWRGPAMPEE